MVVGVRNASRNVPSVVVSKDSLTFSGQNNFPMASMEITRQRERRYTQVERRT